MTTENKILSSLSYLSIFFMPLLFPVVVFALTSNNNHPEAHRNAITAFWLHLLPSILIPVAVFLGLLATGQSFSTSNLSTFSLVLFLIVGLIGLVILGMFIYNLYRGIKVWVD
jgi:small-conductance mechanosensitive channel